MESSATGAPLPSAANVKFGSTTTSRVGNAVHLGYPARPWLYQPLGRTGPSQSFGKLHDELQGLIPGGERGRAPRGVYAWLRLSVVRLGHRCAIRGGR